MTTTRRPRARPITNKSRKTFYPWKGPRSNDVNVFWARLAGGKGKSANPARRGAARASYCEIHAVPLEKSQSRRRYVDNRPKTGVFHRSQRETVCREIRVRRRYQLIKSLSQSAGFCWRDAVSAMSPLSSDGNGIAFYSQKPTPLRTPAPKQLQARKARSSVR